MTTVPNAEAAGLAAARERWAPWRAVTVVDENLLRQARDLLPYPKNSIASIAKLLGVSPGT